MSIPAAETAHPANLVNVVAQVDETFLIIFAISALLLVLLTGAMVFFVIRYSRKRHPVAADFDGNFWAELIWIVLPTILVLGMFWSGWHSYRALRDAPPDALAIKVTARMWSWDFEYPDGRHSGALVVPVGQAVKLSLTSLDVIHGFFAPAFRLKIDTVPGLTTYGWFRADKPGEFVIFCSVYCGLEHAKMLSVIRSVSNEEYQRFLAEKPGQAQAPGSSPGSPIAGPEAGRAVAEAQGCLGCHSLDGSAGAGPSLKGLFGAKSSARDRAVVDRAFVEAILRDPARRLGKPSMMPAFPALTEPEREALLALLESLAAQHEAKGAHQ